jgi:glycine/D-amino acid oxidase-like deaminating enzyme
MNDHIETLIVGGGISGLGCARTLHDAGRSFLLVTDRLGGRMHHSADGSMNFGAVYVNADYRHVLRYVARGRAIRLREIYGQTTAGPKAFWHWRHVRSLRPLVRLVLRLRQLRHMACGFRKSSEQVPQQALAPHYAIADRYRRQPAGELIKELGLGGLHDDYLRLVFQATLFMDPLETNGLVYLAALLPLVVSTWAADFTHTYDKLTNGYAAKILLDRVQSLQRRLDGSWEVCTAGSRSFRATNVVLAAPYHNLASLYPVPRPDLSVPATVLFVRGQRRPLCHNRFLLLRPDSSGVAMVWRQSGRDQVIAVRPRPDLETVYQNPEVVASVSWKTAIMLSSGDWVPLRLEPGLYLAGDYNLCGLEDSFLTGMCAANHILRSATGHVS